MFKQFIMLFHQWEYRNPYDRTCKICGRHEVEHCWGMSYFEWNSGWWEIFDDGDLTKHTNLGKRIIAWIKELVTY